MKKTDFSSLLKRNLSDQPPAAEEGKGRMLDQVMAGGAPAPRATTALMKDIAREIDLDHIRPDPDQPRRSMTDEGLQELAASIAELGVIQPITVTWTEELQVYTIVTGHRRYEASRLAGRTTIPALILATAPDQKVRLQQQLVENIQREGIKPLEEARAVAALMEAFGLSGNAVAAKIGKPATYVKELLSLLKLPPETIEKGRDLPKRALVEIARAESDEDRQRLLEVALSSPNPFQAVQTARKPRKTSDEPRTEQFRSKFQIPDWGATVTVAFDRPPDAVSKRDVVEALTHLIQSLIAEEMNTPPAAASENPQVL